MNKHLNILLISSYLWEFAEGMFGPLFAVFSQRVGGDILDITSAWAIFLIVTGTLILIFGKISDKIGKEKMLVYGYALNAVLTFGYLLVDSPAKLLLIQMGLGVSTALATPTWDALYSKYEDKKNAGFEWGLDSGASKIIMGIGILIGGYLLVNYSFSTLFIIMGIVQVMATIYILPLLWTKRK